MDDKEGMSFIAGGNGAVYIRFHDLTATEAARLIGGIIGQVYDLNRQSKVTVDICSSPLPILPDDRKKHD